MKNNVSPVFYMMIGIPGSGKSTFAREFLSENAIIVSTDEIRKEINGDPSNQSQIKKVWSIALQRCANILLEEKNCCLDATNVNPVQRKEFREKLKEKYYAPTPEEQQYENENALERVPYREVAIVSDTHFSRCLRQNLQRDRVVPEEVLYKMHTTLEKGKYSLFGNENWDTIWHFSC